MTSGDVDGGHDVGRVGVVTWKQISIVNVIEFFAHTSKDFPLNVSIDFIFLRDAAEKK